MNTSILYVHLNNDYTGSTRVLADVIRRNRENYDQVFVLTSNPNTGFLSDLNVEYYSLPYKSYRNKYLRNLYLMCLQCIVLFKILILFRKQKELTIYINTLIPFGAAIAGKLLSQRVIYHIHETSVRPQFLEKWMLYITNTVAEKVIYVSLYSCQKLGVNKPESEVIYNTLSDTFVTESNKYLTEDKEKKTILMLSSLNKHKGIDVFVELAKLCPENSFELVISAHQTSITRYFQNTQLPSNLQIFDAQSNVHPFYNRAMLVLNLSIPPYWIESFGMTILEAQYYGIPCIVPPIGGPTELIIDHYNGYLINPQELNQLRSIILSVANDQELYATLSANTRNRVQQFIKDASCFSC